MKNERESLSLKGSNFQKMISQADEIIQKALKTLEERNSDSARFTINIQIQKVKEETGEESGIAITRDITSTIQEKEKIKDGKVFPGSKIAIDKETGQYVIKQGINGQMDIFGYQ